jgi:hypothetical protein
MPRALALALGLALAASPARADQVHFTGQTTVDQLVIRDTLQNIAQVAAARGCSRLTAVESTMLPADYHAPDAAERGDRPGLHYERWDVTLCGAVVPHLVGFWPAADGGTMFQIILPYPADAPRAASVPAPATS